MLAAGSSTPSRRRFRAGRMRPLSTASSGPMENHFPRASRLPARRPRMAHSRNSVHGVSQDPAGRAFTPGTNQADSTGALAPEARFNAPLIFLAPVIVLRRCRLACVVFLVLAPILLPAQDPTLRMDVKLVNLFVNVTDQTGAIVGGLKKEDFKVAEDGRPQEISIFERESELPLNLTLAIDTSGSTFKDRAIEQDASRRFVHALLRSQDQMSLIEFATDVRLLVAFTNKVSQIDHALGALRVGDATALYDAIYLGAQGLAKKDGRKVLVLVSDGGDTAKNTTYAEALEQALRGEVMIYSIIDVPIEASAGRDIGGEHALITLAEQTGGKSFYENEGGLDKAFARVSEDLRTQYLLGYYPRNQVKGLSFHRVLVTVPRAASQDFNLRHRTGYYADAQAQIR